MEKSTRRKKIKKVQLWPIHRASLKKAKEWYVLFHNDCIEEPYPIGKRLRALEYIAKNHLRKPFKNREVLSKMIKLEYTGLEMINIIDTHRGIVRRRDPWKDIFNSIRKHTVPTL